jgi:hypothetical protein
MKMYAKIENETTKECSVGVGTNIAFYQSIGMTEMEVEQVYDGKWYVKGYAPEKPQSVINEERIAELKAKLAETDHIVLEMAENALLNGGNLTVPTNTETDYASVLSNRAAWRAELAQLT